MERDLAAIRARRAERERAAGAAKVRQVSPVPDERPTELSGELSLPKPAPVAEPSEENQDTIMTDEAPKPDPVDSTNLTGEGNPEPSAGQEANSEPQEAPSETRPSPEMSTSTDPLPSTDEQVDAPETTQEPSTTANDPSTAMEMPTAAELQDADFESMFNDVEGTNADNDINFDLDFSADANMGQDLINDSAFGDITATNNGLIDLNAASNEDINTLLPGLENYVHDGDEFAMLDMPPATSMAGNAGLPQATTAGNVNMGDGMAEAAPVESNFDDMFFGSGDFTMGGTEDGDMGDDGIGDFGDFDEAWFKTDEK